MVAANRRPAADGLSALFDVFVLAQAVQELLAEALADAPLSPEEYAVYSQLLATPGTTVSALATALTAPLTTVSDWIRTLDQRGHVRRAVRPQDRRSVGLSLTPAGRRAHRDTNQRFERAQRAFVGALPVGEDELRRRLQEAVAAAATARDVLASDARATA